MYIKNAPDLCKPNRWAVAYFPTFLKMRTGKQPFIKQLADKRVKHLFKHLPACGPINAQKVKSTYEYVYLSQLNPKEMLYDKMQRKSAEQSRIY